MKIKLNLRLIRIKRIIIEVNINNSLISIIMRRRKNGIKGK